MADEKKQKSATHDLLDRIPDVKTMLGKLVETGLVDEDAIKAVRNSHEFTIPPGDACDTIVELFVRSGKDLTKARITMHMYYAMVVNKLDRLTDNGVAEIRNDEHWAKLVMMKMMQLSPNDKATMTRMSSFSEQLGWDAIDVMSIYFSDMAGPENAGKLMAIMKDSMHKMYPEEFKK